MLSARSPKYPALHDPESGVFFQLGKATVTEEQALQLAERRFTDGILIGELDADGRIVNEQPAKDWRKALRRGGDGEGSEAGGSGSGEKNPSSEATTVAKKTPRR